MIDDSHLVCPEDLFARDYESEFFQQVVHSFLDVFVFFELRFRGFFKRKIDKQSMMINQQNVDGTVKKKPRHISIYTMVVAQHNKYQDRGPVTIVKWKSKNNSRHQNSTLYYQKNDSINSKSSNAPKTNTSGVKRFVYLKGAKSVCTA